VTDCEALFLLGRELHDRVGELERLRDQSPQ